MILCKKCAKAFIPYRRLQQSLIIYFERVQFIHDHRFKGVLMSDMGPLYYIAKGMDVPGSALFTNWASRIVHIYKGKKKAVKLLEIQNPWLKEFYRNAGRTN